MEDIRKELGRRRTEAARRERSQRALQRRIDEAACLLRAHGWEVAKIGPPLVTDQDGDQWARGRDDHYYLLRDDGEGLHESRWTLTLDMLQGYFGIIGEGA